LITGVWAGYDKPRPGGKGFTGGAICAPIWARFMLSAMKDKPVIVSIAMSKPMVFSEFEKEASAILVNFDVQDQAILDILTGVEEPSGLLPMQMPADMVTVEKQKEDVPFDMNCHIDSEGNSYDFGFGLNWNGVIHDARTQKYSKSSK
jgi:beta-glucosidase